MEKQRLVFRSPKKDSPPLFLNEGLPLTAPTGHWADEGHRRALLTRSLTRIFICGG
jgi:hypothetical protein